MGRATGVEIKKATTANHRTWFGRGQHHLEHDAGWSPDLQIRSCRRKEIDGAKRLGSEAAALPSLNAGGCVHPEAALAPRLMPAARRRRELCS